MITEPLGGWRKGKARESKTAVDLAEEIKEVLDGDYPRHAQRRVGLGQPQHSCAGLLVQAFDPAETRRLLNRLEIHYTPKYGSGLDMAEIELSVVTEQCRARRIGDIDTLRREAKAWADARNDAQTGVDWQFTNEQARIKLKHLYPQVTMK
jgi:hypothetical protein